MYLEAVYAFVGKAGVVTAPLLLVTIIRRTQLFDLFGILLLHNACSAMVTIVELFFYSVATTSKNVPLCQLDQKTVIAFGKIASVASILKLTLYLFFSIIVATNAIYRAQLFQDDIPVWDSTIFWALKAASIIFDSMPLGLLIIRRLFDVRKTTMIHQQQQQQIISSSTSTQPLPTMLHRPLVDTTIESALLLNSESIAAADI